MKRREWVKRILLLGGGLATASYFVRPTRFFQDPDTDRLLSMMTLLDELVDTIIPATDTPGAKEAGVGATVMRMVQQCTDRRTQYNFMNGLDDLMDHTLDVHGRDFVDCTPAERFQVMEHFEKQAPDTATFLGKAQRRVFGDSFFATLKQYSAIAYCSSELGATQGLRYDRVPGEFIPILPLAPGAKAWATF